MKIINIKIEEFGCLTEKSYDFSEGFNLTVGDNESGKSTLLAFIKFIFYGLPKKTLETAAERDKSFGWRSNTASGVLTLSDKNGDVYTICRRAVRRKGEKRETVSEECRIIDEKSGTQVYNGRDPGDVFLGVSPSVFESTCFIRQMGVTDIRASDVGSALENILMSADESVDVEKALDKLENARKLLLHKKGSGGLLYDLESERDALSARLERAKANYSRLLSVTELSDKLRRQAVEKRRELDKLEDLSAALSKAETVKRFDRLHEKENELSELENKLKQFRSEAASRDGFVPDAAYVSALGEALGGISAAEAEYERAALSLEESERALESEKNRPTRKSPLTPDEIRSRGGADQICRELEQALLASDKKKRTAKGLFAAFGVTAALAAILVSLSIPLSIPLLLYAAILPAALSIPALTMALSSLSAAKKLKMELENELSSMATASFDISSAENGISEIRKCLLLCLEDEALLKDLEARADKARSVTELRGNDLDGARARAKSLIAKWKSEPVGDIGSALRRTAAEAKCFTEGCDSLMREILMTKSQAQGLKSGLDGIDEADLRARVSAHAMEIYESGGVDDIMRRRRFCAEALRSMNEKAHESEKELVRLENESESPAHLASALEENRKTFEREKLRFDAVVMAQSALTQASGDIRSSVSPALRSRAEEYMAALTDKKYSELGIGKDYSLSAKNERDGVRSAELLSAGTRDSAYLSLRLALLEVIFEGERPFLAIDEALSQLDDKRAAAALRLLSAYCHSGGQCILFTCHSREEKLLEGITKANIIKV